MIISYKDVELHQLALSLIHTSNQNVSVKERIQCRLADAAYIDQTYTVEHAVYFTSLNSAPCKMLIYSVFLKSMPMIR